MAEHTFRKPRYAWQVRQRGRWSKWVGRSLHVYQRVGRYGYCVARIIFREVR
jgi:hypothetical protein